MMPGKHLIPWASRFVPRSRRDGWRREWEAEVAYAWGKLHGTDPPSRLKTARLRVRILMCVIDALWERKETMRMSGLFNDLRCVFTRSCDKPENDDQQANADHDLCKHEERFCGSRASQRARHVDQGVPQGNHQNAAGAVEQQRRPGGSSQNA